MIIKFNYLPEILHLCIVNGMFFFMLLSSSIIICRLRDSLIIDPPPEIDGLKLIWRVMKYILLETSIPIEAKCFHIQ